MAECKGEEAMTRKARCCCGALQVDVVGEPAFVAACHCVECQRRTGSVFGVGAYFLKPQLHITNIGKTYVRDGLDGRKARIQFCPNCGTSVFWEIELLPDHYGVAVGTFTDSEFQAPTMSVWEEKRHPWVVFPNHTLRAPRQPITEITTAEQLASGRPSP